MGRQDEPESVPRDMHLLITESVICCLTQGWALRQGHCPGSPGGSHVIKGPHRGGRMVSAEIGGGALLAVRHYSLCSGQLKPSERTHSSCRLG